MIFVLSAINSCHCWIYFAIQLKTRQSLFETLVTVAFFGSEFSLLALLFWINSANAQAFTYQTRAMLDVRLNWLWVFLRTKNLKVSRSLMKKNLEVYWIKKKILGRKLKLQNFKLFCYLTNSSLVCLHRKKLVSYLLIVHSIEFNCLHVFDGWKQFAKIMLTVEPEWEIIFTQFNKREVLRKLNTAPQIAIAVNAIWCHSLPFQTIVSGVRPTTAPTYPYACYTGYCEFVRCIRRINANVLVCYDLMNSIKFSHLFLINDVLCTGDYYVNLWHKLRLKVT